MLFWQLVVSGLSIGSLYALVALGIVLLYRTSRVLNFAHGDMAMITTMVTYSLMTAAGAAFGTAAVLTLLVAFAAGAGFYFLVLRPVKEATLLGQIITTAGFALVLSGAGVVLWGADTKVLPFPLSRSVVYHVGGVAVSQLAVGSFVIAVVAVAGLYLLVQKTRFGLAMRAVSQNDVAARVLGIPVRRVFAVAWGVSATLGAVAGMLLAPATLLSPFMMFDPFLKGFAGAVLGGLDSLPGAILGALILGVVENLFGGYVSTSLRTTVAFLIIIAVLLVRPEGLLGRKFMRRV
ncbi:MAG TPA: branched-chain amino acid ABC transporter permease [Limnochordales bacterium]|nr:branched-chain amino acid ABC transporter permease [Limnochordales bacterium]